MIDKSRANLHGIKRGMLPFIEHIFACNLIFVVWADMCVRICQFHIVQVCRVPPRFAHFTH